MSRECIQCGAVLGYYSTGELCFTCRGNRQKELIEKIGEGLHYNVDDMCFVLDLSPEQVRRLGREGVIPGKIPGIKQHLYLRAVVDQWIRSGGKISRPELLEHYSEVALTAMKLADVMDYYYKNHRFTIEPLISSDFPYTTHLPESPTISERELSNLIAHLGDEMPELVPIVEYPKACRQWFALGDRKWEKEKPFVWITGDLILKLRIAAGRGDFTGRCPDCP